MTSNCKILLVVGCDIEARNNVGNTAVHVMVSHQRLSCLVCLLSHGANVDTPDADGQTPLHLAVEKGHIPSIQVSIFQLRKQLKKDKCHSIRANKISK